MDKIPSGDPVLSHVVASKPSRDRFGGLPGALSTLEVIGVAALVLLVVWALLGGLLDNAAIAIGGLAAPLLLGIGCHFAIKRRRPPLERRYAGRASS